jgi:hypothetical protein
MLFSRIIDDSRSVIDNSRSIITLLVVMMILIDATTWSITYDRHSDVHNIFIMCQFHKTFFGVIYTLGSITPVKNLGNVPITV